MDFDAKLTKRFVETIIPDVRKASIFWDDSLKGLALW